MVAHITTPSNTYMAFSFFFLACIYNTKVTEPTWATGYRCYRANVDGEFELKN